MAALLVVCGLALLLMAGAVVWYAGGWRQGWTSGPPPIAQNMWPTPGSYSPSWSRRLRERFPIGSSEKDLIRDLRREGFEINRARRIAGYGWARYPCVYTLTVAWRAESMMGLREDPPRGPLDSLAALRAWADSYLRRPEVVAGGCSFGSLAAEVLKSDLDVGDAVADGFARWRAQFDDGLTAMRDRGRLRADADVDQLATSLMAAFQGGLLLTQAARDLQPLRQALDAALAHVASFAIDGAT